MTKKMTGYLGVASFFLCMILLTACANNSDSRSSGGANGTGTSKATASSTASAAAMVARKASGSKPPKATPKPVVITISPRPTPTMVPTQVPAPAPTTPAMAAPTPTPPPITVTNPGVSAAASAVLTLINKERVNAGLKALTWDADLQTSAHEHNLTMQAANTLSHQLPGEAAFGDRERAAGVNWTSAAENIGVGSGDPTQAAVGLNTLMFNETPPDNGHRLNILSSSSNVIGIDVIVDSTHNKVWLTEDFAHI